MSVLLHRLGRFAFRRHWFFITGWMLTLGVVIAFAVANGGGAISASVTIDGTQAQEVLDDLRTEMPAASGGQGTIVFTTEDNRPLGEGAEAEAIARAAAGVSELPYVIQREVPAGGATQAPEGMTPPEGMEVPEGMTPPEGMELPEGMVPPGMDGPRPLVVDGAPVPGVMVSEDGSVATLQMQFDKQVDDLPEGTVDEVVTLVEDAVAPAGLTVLPTDSLKAMHPPIGGGEAIGIGVAAVVLVMTLGSLVAAGLPLLTAVTGVGIGLGGALALSQHITMTSSTPVLALMIGLAVGIDYALFIVNRQRRLIITEGLDAQEATGRAVGTAGSAVVFAGTTVIVALVALTIIGIDFLSTMALVAATTVLFAVLIAVTLLPALLGLVGERIVSRRARERGRRIVDEERHGLAHRWATMVVARPWVVVTVVVVFLALLAWPVSQMRLGMPSGDTAGLETSERQAYDAITWTFGEGWNGPLVVVAHPEGDATFDDTALTAVGDRLAEHPDVVDVRMMGATDDKTTAVWSVVPTDGPLDASTADLVHDLRAAGFADGLDVDLGVTGLTAINLDISERLADVLPVYIGIIVLISLAILTLVFRSVVIPVKATAGFLLSILATFGLTTLVFQWGTFKEAVGVDTAGPLLSFLPIMVTGILYGLAMDYEVFLVSSMRQAHVHGHPGKEAIVHGFEQASRVVLAAAVIMVSVFAAFVLTDDTTIKQFGFALSTGILLDAFLVRMTLGPALMAIMGRHSWSLPRWMARVLPDLDIEGDRLVRRVGSPKG